MDVVDGGGKVDLPKEEREREGEREKEMNTLIKMRVIQYAFKQSYQTKGFNVIRENRGGDSGISLLWRGVIITYRKQKDSTFCSLSPLIP